MYVFLRLAIPFPIIVRGRDYTQKMVGISFVALFGMTFVRPRAFRNLQYLQADFALLSEQSTIVIESNMIQY